MRTQSAIIGGDVDGVVNRLLIPFGLHNVINSVVWFIFGRYTDANGDVVTGDLHRFFAHDPSAGTFMTGLFPDLHVRATRCRTRHMAHRATRPVSAALAAFITGVTEPIEFPFMFVAWPLYLVHAFLTGSSLLICKALGIHDGFSFSAGAIDYVLNFGIAQKAWLLIPIGVVHGIVYYAVFHACTVTLVRQPRRPPQQHEMTEPRPRTISAALVPSAHIWSLPRALTQ